MARNRISPKVEAGVVAISKKTTSTKGTTRRKCHYCGKSKNIPRKSHYVYRDGTALCNECAGKDNEIEYSLPNAQACGLSL